MALLVKNLPGNAGDIRDMGSTPGSGRSPGEGHGSPLQYSCLENLRDKGAWQATVHGVITVARMQHSQELLYSTVICDPETHVQFLTNVVSSELSQSDAAKAKKYPQDQ